MDFMTFLTVLISILNLLFRLYEQWHLKRDRRRYREALESRRNGGPTFDGGTFAIWGHFFFEDLLLRHCSRRKEEYIEPLRYYRLYILEWSTRRASREAEIAHSTYKQIEGKCTRRSQLDTVARICAAFGADAERLGFAACYHYTAKELAQIAQRVDKLVEWRKEEERARTARSAASIRSTGKM